MNIPGFLFVDILPLLVYQLGYSSNHLDSTSSHFSGLQSKPNGVRLESYGYIQMNIFIGVIRIYRKKKRCELKIIDENIKS